jgi:Ethanolamine utilization protein EutJ (predicted chaperonin)
LPDSITHKYRWPMPLFCFPQNARVVKQGGIGQNRRQAVSIRKNKKEQYEKDRGIGR